MAFKMNSFYDLFKGSLYKDLDKFFDATIITEDGTSFKAHKLFLSLRSEYFRAYFRSNIGDTDSLVLAISKDILENILIFIYISDVRLDDENIQTIIEIADYLLMDDLLVQCKRFALQKMSIENCTSLLIASHFVERLGIRGHCYRFVQLHFGRLILESDSGIEELPFNLLKNLLSENSLGVPDEDIVWKAIVLWVNGNNDERLENVPELLSYIRWKSVSDWLVSSICKHTIFRENIFCKSTDLEKYVLSSKYEIVPFHNLDFCQERLPRKMYVIMSKKSSHYPSDALEIYLTYDEQLDIWRKIGETNDNFHTLIAKGKLVFMFNTLSNNIKAFDLLQKTWVETEKIRIIRQGYCVVQNENHIFVLGGFIFMSNSQLSEMECYDPIKDTWTYCMPIPPMNICGAEVLNEMLYVVGYLENSDRLEMKALAYDTLRDKWSNIERPKQFRTNFGMINFRERLYIFGGRTEENSVTTSVEIYNAKEKLWEEFPALPFPYEQPHAIILQDKLMVFDDCPASGIAMPRFLPCAWDDKIQTWVVEDIFSPFSEIHMYEFCCIEDRGILRKLTKENKDPETVWAKTPFAINGNSLNPCNDLI